MIKVIKLEVEHLIELIDDPSTKEIQNFSGMITLEHTETVKNLPDCYAIVDVYGRVLACTGLNGIEAWTIFRSDLGTYLITVFREIKKLLHAHPFPRIISYISKDFKKGATWMKILGFKVEAENVLKYGKIHTLYSLTKENS